MSLRQDLGKFIQEGNLVGLAIAFVLGVATAALFTALTDDLLTPIIGAAFHIDFVAWQYDVNGSIFYPGSFLNAAITFALIFLVLFFLIGLPYVRWQAQQAAIAAKSMRPCPECQTSIPIAATRCSACAQPVPPAPAPAAMPGKSG
jgi:large conductance mechanosensitive channel